MAKTIAIDFDGVIHTYDKGWGDGTIYGELIPGSEAAIRSLMDDYAVIIFTTRWPAQVAVWIEQQTEIPCTTEHDEVFWNEQGILLITNHKYPAVAYIDDRAIKFENWPQTMGEIAKLY